MQMHSPAEASIMPPASPPLIVCADADEAERLALRDLDAIDGSIPREDAHYLQYHGREVIVTPRGRDAAFGTAIVLSAKAKCSVEGIRRDADIAGNILELPREPMFDAADAAARRRRPLDWTALAKRELPQRDWAIAWWLGMRHVTLLAGPGGIDRRKRDPRALPHSSISNPGR